MEAGKMHTNAIHSGVTKTMNSYKDNELTKFLKNHSIKDSSLSTTNTRIGNNSKEIYGGNYHIPDNDYNKFLSIYADTVILNKNEEYLTEKQLDDDGCIYVDLDLRYDYDVTTRQHTTDHINDLLDCYLAMLSKIYQFDDTPFKIFVLQKANVNRVADKKITKDGIHIMINIQCDRTVQIILRDKVMKEIENIWCDLPIKNKMEDVFDEGITIGYTNCQLYGSRKPGFDAYEISYIYDIHYDVSKNDFRMVPVTVSTFDVKKNIHMLSVRNRENPSFFLRNDFIPIYNEYKRLRGSGSPTKKKNTLTPMLSINPTSIDFETSNVVSYASSIKNKEDLEILLNALLDNLTICNEHELKESYEYAMVLPESYYGLGSYTKWMKVGWALKNTSEKLLIVWIVFSAKSETFKYSDIPDLCDRWKKMDIRKVGNGVTKRSLMHWAKSESPEEYEKIRENSIDFHVENAINGSGQSSVNDKKGECGDFDLATVLYHIFKDQYVCTSVKSNIWFEYSNNRWREIDSGTTLRKAISTTMRTLFQNKSENCRSKIGNASVPIITQNVQIEDSNDDHHNLEQEKIRARASRSINIALRLSRTNDKKNIMTEAKELFYDGSFMNKLDTNPYLLCFNNGVVDFKEKIFRKGRPEDCISKCTNIDYNPIHPQRDLPIINEINEFFHKLFPRQELYDYMWSHLASTLIGTTSNQTFHMYVGQGSNGKSVLMELMKMVLGEYKGDVPLSLVIGDRPKIGGLAPEIVELKGIRYAVMQEPSKEDKSINEGPLKQLTGGDPLQARAPYQIQTITFIPQFTLVLCANLMLEIKSNDHGTWRRIRIVPFESLFCENPVLNDPEKPYQYKLNKDINQQFELWKEVLMAMLVEKAFETDGKVKDCDAVMVASNAYRQSQDYIAGFIGDKVIVDATGSITKTEINAEFSSWYLSTYGRGGPSVREVHDYMDKKFGKQKNQKWMGVRIRYESNEFEMPVVNDDIDPDEL